MTDDLRYKLFINYIETIRNSSLYICKKKIYVNPLAIRRYSNCNDQTQKLPFRQRINLALFLNQANNETGDFCLLSFVFKYWCI